MQIPPSDGRIPPYSPRVDELQPGAPVEPGERRLSPEEAEAFYREVLFPNPPEGVQEPEEIEVEDLRDNVKSVMEEERGAEEMTIKQKIAGVVGRVLLELSCFLSAGGAIGGGLVGLHLGTIFSFGIGAAPSAYIGAGIGWVVGAALTAAVGKLAIALRDYAGEDTSADTTKLAKSLVAPISILITMLISPSAVLGDALSDLGFDLAGRFRGLIDAQVDEAIEGQYE